MMREYSDGMLVIMRGVNLNPGADPEDMVSVRIWVQHDRIISARNRRLLATAELHSDLRAGVGPKTSGDFIVMLAEGLEASIGPAVDALDETLENSEEQFQDPAEIGGYGGEFSSVRRQSARLRRYLMPQRDALEDLSRQPNLILSTSHCLRLREETDKLTRYLEDLDLVRERAMVAQEELLSRLALEQNSRIYVLSIVAAIFLPLSFLTGLWGMNVAGLPGTENTTSFWRVLMLLFICAAGILGIFKYKKWF
jgi:zinc transporter